MGEQRWLECGNAAITSSKGMVYEINDRFAADVGQSNPLVNAHG
jgi:hypothetical protein